jgi:glycosyltransferase EpsF
MDSGKCKVIPNSVDESKYRVLNSKEKKMIRQQFSIDSDAKLFVTVANLRTIKNHSFLLDVAYELKKRNYAFMLCLIGEGEQREFIEKKIKDLQLTENVILLGNRSDVPEILGAFDGMIFPSLSEGFGGAVLEAQLVGIPVIASDMVPDSTDMGIGMVKYLPLNKSCSEWADEIISFFNQDFSWTREKVLEKMQQKHFTIRSTAREYLKAYGIDEATINKAII